MNKLYLLRLENGSTVEGIVPPDVEVTMHEWYVFRRDFFTDMGEAMRLIGDFAEDADVGKRASVTRKAALEDLRVANTFVAKSKHAMIIAKELVAKLKLQMKLLNAHYSLDGKQISIQFSAEGRVDFRELVKELSHALCARIELRQIGVRDETGIYGGIAVCGQQLCCCRFLKEFSSINVKMAKDQDLTLTPSSISGACGRLKCCLKYEHEGYVELEKNMPRRGDWCETPSGSGRVCDRNLLTQKVSICFEGGNVTQFERAEVTILPPDKRPQSASFGKNESRPGNRRKPVGGNNRSGRPAPAPAPDKQKDDGNGGEK